MDKTDVLPSNQEAMRRMLSVIGFYPQDALDEVDWKGLRRDLSKQVKRMKIEDVFALSVIADRLAGEVNG